jgi:hypothetical protein
MCVDFVGMPYRVQGRLGNKMDSAMLLAEAVNFGLHNLCFFSVLQIRIRCIYDPWIRDKKESGSGSEMNIPDNISESLKTFFSVKNT